MFTCLQIATKSKDTIISTLQAGQEALSNTRAARVVGYGADVTLTATECLVEKVLPEVESEESEDDEEDDETPPTNEGSFGKHDTSIFVSLLL